MSTVTLPLIADTATIDAALAAMKQRRRGAAVVDRGTTLVIAYERELLAARRQGHRLVSQAGALAELGQPAEGSADPSTGLDERHRIAAVRGTNETATVVASDDATLAGLVTPANVGGLARFCCDGPVTHYFPLPYVVAGDWCPLCITAPDAPPHTVRLMDD